MRFPGNPAAERVSTQAGCERRSVIPAAPGLPRGLVETKPNRGEGALTPQGEIACARPDKLGQATPAANSSPPPLTFHQTWPASPLLSDSLPKPSSPGR